MSSPDISSFPLQFQEVEDWYYKKATQDPLNSAFQSLRQRTVCIMGAAGQVGSHLLAKFYELGFDSQQLDLNDNLSLGTLDNLPVPFRDRLDTRSHLDYVRNGPRHPDILIFVGGRSSAPHFQSLQDVLEEIESWSVILQWCVRHQIRLVFASTSSLCKQRPSVENQMVWPGSLYELCKLMMENMAIQQALDSGLKVQICRFFSVYGVTESHKGKFGNLYTQILWHALDQTPFELWGQRDRFNAGEQTRDIIFAPDVVRSILHLLTLKPPTPELGDISELIYNIGQGHPLSVHDMIEHVAAVVPDSYRPQLVETEVPETLHNYVVNTWGDPQKLMNSGYSPLFPDNTENLKFICASLLKGPTWYWQILKRIRSQS